MLGTWGQRIRGTRRMVLALTACILVLGNVCAAAPPQPAGEMRWALYVTQGKRI